MEPKLPAPNLGPEQSSAVYGQNVERIPASESPERAMEAGQERREQRSEAAPATIIAPPILPTPIAVPVPTPLADDTVVVTTDDNPIVANDEDLIEKEWVDKAKKIILQTKDDPFRREQEVVKLQADYLRKRYGKELGAS